MGKTKKAFGIAALVGALLAPVSVASPANAFHYNGFHCGHWDQYYHSYDWHKVVFVTQQNSGGYHWHRYYDYVWDGDSWSWYTSYWRRCNVA